MEQRIALEETGRKILESVRTETYLAMPFMGEALGAFSFVMDLRTATVGTDAEAIRFNAKYLMRMYVERPIDLNRTYVHMVLHCLLGHPFDTHDHPDEHLWNLCCDIAVESVLDTMEYPCFHTLVHDRRTSLYRELKEKAGVLTAQRLYAFFSEGERDYPREFAIADEFRRDDHGFWQLLEDGEETPQPPLPQEDSSGGEGNSSGRKNEREKKPSGGGSSSLPEDWKRHAKSVEAVLKKAAGTESGELFRSLSAQNVRRRDWRDYLRRFMVVREEARIDPDSFDYGFYNLGLTLYGNMPLIEENEFSVNKKVEELVIVIDSSASTKGRLVQEFLNETASLLLTTENFFRRVRIRILECDERVQNDIRIDEPEQMKRYAEHFVLRGGFGTDFRPAFAYVAQLKARGELKGPKGLLYFTDGFGTFPAKPPDYDVAFVYPKDSVTNDMETPDWAMRLYI